MSNVKSRGFTLVELVVVITILGILAAFAVPRFLSLDGKAREAAIDGLAGSLRSSAALTHSLWLASGSPATITMEGTTITMANGYPNLATIDDTLADTTGFTFVPATGVFTKDGAPTPANCAVTYTAAAAGGSPSIAVVKTGC
jgi:MSHA pilin protein MshA